MPPIASPPEAIATRASAARPTSRTARTRPHVTSRRLRGPRATPRAVRAPTRSAARPRCAPRRAVRHGRLAACAGLAQLRGLAWRSAAFWSSAATRRPRRPAHCRRGRCSPRSSSLTGWRRAHFHCRRPEAPLRCCGQPLRNYARRVARNDGSLEGACLGAPFRPRAARAACSLSPARTPPPTHVLCS